MCLQAATGNDLLNAIDIKEGMEYSGGIENTKVTVAEIVPDQGKYLVMAEKLFILAVSQAIWMKQIYLRFVLYITAQKV